MTKKEKYCATCGREMNLYNFRRTYCSDECSIKGRIKNRVYISRRKLVDEYVPMYGHSDKRLWKSFK